MKLATYQAPPGGDHVSLGTVCGFPLEPGERVVFFVAPNHKSTKTKLVLLGILLAVLVFGLFVILYAAMYESWGIRFVAVTNKRVIVQKGTSRAPQFVRLDAVTALGPKNTASSAALTDLRYWADAASLVLETKSGALRIDKSADLPHLGPAIANALYTTGYFDRVPTVACPP